MKHLLIDCTWVLICCTHHYYILSSDHEWNALGLLPYCLKRFMGWAEGVIVKFVQKGVIYSLSLRETARTAPASWTLNDPWWALSWSDLTWPALVFEQKRVKRTVIPHRPRVRLVMLNSFHPAQVMIVASSERKKKRTSNPFRRLLWSQMRRLCFKKKKNGRPRHQLPTLRDLPAAAW